MPAFKAALEAGAEGLECDVQLTKDGIPVIIHDESLERTTNGKGWLKDYTYDELVKLDAGSWFDPSFSGATIPTLKQLLERVAETPLLLNIEFKMGWSAILLLKKWS